MSSTVQSARGARTVVLVADDDPHINTLITRLLLREGYGVIHVHDGHDAIERLIAERVDLLILDLMMPRVDGFGVIKYLEENRPDLLSHTIVVTAVPESKALMAFRSVCTVLSKPFETAELLAAVETCSAP